RRNTQGLRPVLCCAALSGLEQLCQLHFLYFLPDLCFDLICQFRIIKQELLNCISSLAEFIVVIAEPATALLDYAELYTHVNDLAGLGDTFTEDDIEFRRPEWRGYLVFDDFHLYTVAYGFIAILDLRAAAYVKPYGRIELKCITAGSCFGIAEHDADLFPQLVDEDANGICLRNGGGEFTQCLAHKPCLESH